QQCPCQVLLAAPGESRKLASAPPKAGFPRNESTIPRFPALVRNDHEAPRENPPEERACESAPAADTLLSASAGPKCTRAAKMRARADRSSHPEAPARAAA